MKISILLIAFVFLFYSCTSPNKTDSSNDDSVSWDVQYAGALKNMMKKGDISSKAELADFENTEHIYAIGAMENLKGEIQIINGESFNTLVVDDSLFFDSTFDKKATLLVNTIVPLWTTHDIPDHVKTYDALEKFVGTKAKQHGINNKEPFPFMLEGTATSFDWHVINWKDGDKKHTHEKHINSGLHGTIENQEAQYLGFYSDSHHRIFTHHTTNMHIHVKTNNNSIAGHMDNLVLGADMKLMLPSIE